MSHIVIHDDKNGVTQYRRFEGLEEAVEHLEELHNGGDADGARLYRLDEVEFAVKSYIKVEIGGAAPDDVATSDETHEVTRVPADEHEIMPADDDDEIEYVEAAIGPIETMESPGVPEYAMEPADEAVGSQGDSRRGLFGR